MTILLNALVGGILPEYTDGLTGTKFTGSTWSEVLAQVQRFYAEQGRDPSAAAAQLVDYVCKNYPQQCVKESDEPVPGGGGFVQVLYTSEFIDNKIKRDKEIVPSEVVASRLSVCENCTLCKVTTSGMGCGSCQKRFNETVSKKFSISEPFKACSGLGALIAVLVKVPNAEYLGKFGGNWRDLLLTLPANCWLKKEETNEKIT
jgi:hypothetical protein